MERDSGVFDRLQEIFGSGSIRATLMLKEGATFDEAEEAEQQAMYAVIEAVRLRKLRDGAACWAYAYAAARRSFLRDRRKHRREVFLETLSEVPPEPYASTVEDDLIRQEQRELVRKAAAGLSTKQRKYILRLLDGKTHGEASSDLGSRNAARVLKFRALRGLQRRLVSKAPREAQAEGTIQERPKRRPRESDRD